MVVVMLIAILTVIAAPAMSRARDDRIAFDFARQISGVIHRARTRAAGRGAAHLVAIDPGGGANRGRVLLFEALDGVAAASGGPNPVSTCRTAGQWATVKDFTPGTWDTTSRIVEGVNLNGTGVVSDSDISMASYVDGTAKTYIAICITPTGRSYVGSDSTQIAAAITNMAQSAPFTGTVDLRVSRHSGGTAVGLTRHVIVPGGSAPRVRSE